MITDSDVAWVIERIVALYDPDSIYVFGSYAKGAAHEESDLDLFIDYDKESKFSAIELLRIKHYVSDALDIDADVTTRDGLHPLIRDEVVASAERVF